MLLTIFLIAMTANVYINFLSQEKILNWWFALGLRFEKSWFYPIIWGCPMCNAGQMALWYYILFLLDFGTAQSYFDGLFFVSGSIGIAYLINKYVEW